MCDIYQLVISDYRKYGRNSGQHTYVSDAHNSISWLDHVICSQDMHLKLHSIDISDQLPSSDHLPLSFILDSNHSILNVPHHNSPCGSAKVTVNWAKVKDTELDLYTKLTYCYFTKVNILSAIKCTDANCSSPEHRMQINQFYDDVCSTLRQSGVDSILSVKVKDGRDYIVLGFNKFLKELHTAVRTDYIAWRGAAKPRSGLICGNMKRSRLKFEFALRQCKQNVDANMANEHAKLLMNKDMNSFWSGIRKSNNSRLPLATTVNQCTGESNIAEMWQDHHTLILNSVQNSRFKKKC